MTMMMRRPWRAYLKLLNVHIGQALVGKDDGQTLLGHITVCVLGGGCVSVGVMLGMRHGPFPPSLFSSFTYRGEVMLVDKPKPSKARANRRAKSLMVQKVSSPMLLVWCVVCEAECGECLVFAGEAVELAIECRQPGVAALNARGARIVCRRACVSA